MIDHKEILERYEYAYNDEYDQRDLAGKDCVFLEEEDGMWSREAKEQRSSRPRLSVDLISPGIDQATGDQREMNIEAKVIPLANATKDLAEVFSGLLRTISNDCDFDDIRDAAYDEQLKCGYGGWRVLTKECLSDPWKQTIYNKWIPSAHSSLFFDPAAEDYDRSDADWGFVITTTTEKSFKREYPNHDAPGFFAKMFNNLNAMTRLWYPRDRVQVGEFWYKDKKKKTMARLNDGRIIDVKAEEKVLDELLQQGVFVVDEKEVDSYDIKTCKLTGLDILEDWQDWAGSYIPLVPVYGKTGIIDGKKFYRGVTRKSKDSNRMVNYAYSTISETVALAPKDPYWYTPAMKDGHDLTWARFNIDNDPFMPYNTDPSDPGPPKRTGPPSVPNALLSILQSSMEFVNSTMGIHPASLGSFDKRISEQAIESQQAAGDRGVYIYASNFVKSLRHDARIKIDLIQKIYDTQRVEKILKEDGTTEDIVLNHTQYNEINEPIVDEQTGETVIVNDVSKGEYGIEIKTGPASKTRRLETVKQLMSLISDTPTGQMIAGMALDIIIDNMDINKSEDLKKRIRKQMIQAGTVEPTEEEVKEFGLDQEPPPDPMQVALVENVRIQTEKLIEDIKNTQADTQKKLYDTQSESVKTLETMIKALTEKVNAGGQITEQDEDMLQGQTAIVGDAQIDTLRTNELGGAASIDMKEAAQQQTEQPGVPGGGTPQGVPGAPVEYNPTGPTGPQGPRPAPQMPEGVGEE
jgi:hypothetical protein